MRGFRILALALTIAPIWLMPGLAWADEAPHPGENSLPKILSFEAVPPSGTAPLMVQFFIAASDRDGSIASVTWDFGDGTAKMMTTTLAAEHQYKKVGTFAVKVVVSDNRGGTVTASTTVAVPAVRPPAQLLSELIARVTKLGLTEATKTLETALKDLRGANYRGACTGLKTFIGQIEASSGKQVLASEARELVSAAGYIRDHLRCEAGPASRS